MRTVHAVAGLGVIAAATFLAPLVGGRATARSVRSGWYRDLDKPAWTPPDEVFGPVWTALYAGMAVATWLVWKRLADAAQEERGTDSPVAWSPAMRLPLGLYGAQLTLNALWSVLFFGARRPAWGLVDIVPLLALIFVTARVYARVSKPAAALLVPYGAWVTYATALNASVVHRNA